MKQAIEKYLKNVFGPPARLLEFKKLGAGVHGTGFLIEVETEKGKKQYVIKDLAPEGLGHDNPSDRASVFLWALDNYNSLPKHIKAIDVIAQHEDGSIHSIGGGKEYFLLMEKAEGVNYFNDLSEFSKKEHLDEMDVKKIRLMTSYLAEIHSMKKDSKTLYRKKLRDTVGHGECLMGVFDSYPDGTLEYGEMAEIVKKSVEWIAKLKPKYKRLSQIHGDFHPGNIWFNPPTPPLEKGGKGGFEIDFVLLDRSRGPWGDPADDITALTINYIFFSVKNHGDAIGSYLEGINLFFDEYIKASGDKEINEVVAPFFAFRGAVVANPIFYPELTSEQRKLIFRFVHNVLDDDGFRLEKVNEYLR
ncbi:MAG: phosphotransferase [Nitrospirae bacterium]|jgi:aminoglycoside phosphotransferase (APT) family kinase protein|nr:phosphotransferase [Nitrospirota bacterium]